MRRLKLPCDDITPIGLWGSDMFLIGVNNDQFEVLRLWNVQTEDVTPATLRDLHTDSVAIPTSPSAGNAASDARSSARKGAPSAAPASPSTPPEPAAPPRGVTAAPASAPSSVAAGRAVAVMQDDEAELIDASAAKGKTPLEIQPAFAAVAQAPAPEAPGVKPAARGATVAVSRGGNGATGAASVTPASNEEEEPRRDGPDLRLESSAQSSTSRSSRTEEARAPKAPRGETQLKGPAKETAKDSGSNAGKLRMTVDGEHLYAEIKGGKIVLKDRTYDSLAHARDSIRRERNKVAVWEYFDEGVKAWRVLNRD